MFVGYLWPEALLRQRKVFDGQTGMFKEGRVVGTIEASKTRSRKLKHVVQLGHSDEAVFDSQVGSQAKRFFIF